MAIKGIDVSQWQGTIDWRKVANDGVRFAILRAGYGREISQKDPTFEYNYKNAKANGVKVGVYWYSYAVSADDAKKEAQACLKIVKGKSFDYPIFFDLEEQFQFIKGRDFCSSLVTAFCDEIKRGGYKSGLYISRSPLQTRISESVAKKYPLWVAEYAPKCNYSGRYDVWQYSSTGRVDGISGNVDMNLCYTDFVNNTTNTNAATKTTPPTVTYRVRTKNGWLPEVVNLSDYAGDGNQILDFAMKVSSGSVKYRVHIKGGAWLPYVTGYNTSDHNNGYAGIGKPIDAIEAIYYAPSGKSYRIKYRVAPCGGNYYDWQYNAERSGGQDGYAGCYGINISKVQFVIV